VRAERRHTPGPARGRAPALRGKPSLGFSSQGFDDSVLAKGRTKIVSLLEDLLAVPEDGQSYPHPIVPELSSSFIGRLKGRLPSSLDRAELVLVDEHGPLFYASGYRFQFAGRALTGSGGRIAPRGLAGAAGGLEGQREPAMFSAAVNGAPKTSRMLPLVAPAELARPPFGVPSSASEDGAALAGRASPALVVPEQPLIDTAHRASRSASPQLFSGGEKGFPLSGEAANGSACYVQSGAAA
jgi:hypothetical protein